MRKHTNSVELLTQPAMMFVSKSSEFLENFKGVQVRKHLFNEGNDLRRCENTQFRRLFKHT